MNRYWGVMERGAAIGDDDSENVDREAVRSEAVCSCNTARMRSTAWRHSRTIGSRVLSLYNFTLALIA